MAEQEENKGVVWNFDDNEGKLIFGMKLEFIKHRDVWDLENAYWSILKLLSETEALFDDSVQADLKKDFDEISAIRTEYKGFINLDDEQAKSDCFNHLNNLYRKLCIEMVDEHLYFRKKQAYTGL